MAIELPPKPIKRRNCKIRTILETIDAGDALQLESALKDERSFPAKYLAKLLTEQGLEISEGPIWSHRGGSCSC